MSARAGREGRHAVLVVGGDGGAQRRVGRGSGQHDGAGRVGRRPQLFGMFTAVRGCSCTRSNFCPSPALPPSVGPQKHTRAQYTTAVAPWDNPQSTAGNDQLVRGLPNNGVNWTYFEPCESRAGCRVGDDDLVRNIVRFAGRIGRWCGWLCLTA